MNLFRKEKKSKSPSTTNPKFSPELLRRGRNQISALINRLQKYRDQDGSPESDDAIDTSMQEYVSNNFIKHVWKIEKRNTAQYQPFKTLLERRAGHFQWLFTNNTEYIGSMVNLSIETPDDNGKAVMENEEGDEVLNIVTVSSAALEQAGMKPLTGVIPWEELTSVDVEPPGSDSLEPVSVTKSEAKPTSPLPSATATANKVSTTKKSMAKLLDEGKAFVHGVPPTKGKRLFLSTEKSTSSSEKKQRASKDKKSAMEVDDVVDSESTDSNTQDDAEHPQHSKKVGKRKFRSELPSDDEEIEDEYKKACSLYDSQKDSALFVSTDKSVQQQHLEEYLQSTGATQVTSDISPSIPNIRGFTNVLSEHKMLQLFRNNKNASFNVVKKMFPETAHVLFSHHGIPSGTVEYDMWKKRMIRLLQREKQWTRSVAEKHVGAYVKFWREQFVELMERAPSHVMNAIKSIRYYVAPENIDTKKGSFIVEMQDGKQMLVTRQFVYDHFEPDVINTVINAFNQSYLLYKEDDEIFLDNTQIIKIRWESFEGKNWYSGYLADGRQITLTDDVLKQFSVNFLQKVKELGQKRKNRFFYLPPGAPRKAECPIETESTYPIVKYQQHGKFSCLFSSLASGLYYFGFDKSADYLSKLASKYSSDQEEGFHNWRRLIEALQKCCKKLEPRKIVTNSERRWDQGVQIGYDPLQDSCHYPIVLQLQDADGGIQHAVTIVEDWVFDSNNHHALPRNRVALDWCCSTDEVRSTYGGVYKGYVLHCRTDGIRKVPLWMAKKKNLF
jgi:hypothetical protein